MTSGIDIAGIVLATLPLCIKIAKAYAEGTQTILNITLHSRCDAALSDFYDEFYWNISEFDTNIAYVWENATGGICRPCSALELSQLHKNPEISANLEKFCKSATSYHQYLLITKRMATLLVQLVIDCTPLLDQASLSESSMFNKLLEFADHRQSQATRSTFFERFRFFKGEKDRNRCIHLLDRWNGRLTSLIEKSLRPRPTRDLTSLVLQTTCNSPWNAIVLNVKDPSARIRALTRDLYNALSRCWSCCAYPRSHEAKFGLNIHRARNHLPETEAEFEMMVSFHSGVHSVGCWGEGIVGIRTTDSPSRDQGYEMHTICEVLGSITTGSSFRLLMEDLHGQNHLWKLDPAPITGSVVGSVPPMSLHQLLAGNAQIGSYEKRELGIICAYSLLLLHDTPWLHSHWDKTSLSFFHKPEKPNEFNQEPDFARPFISTRFQVPTRQGSSIDHHAPHRNPLILALGIVLIEVFKEKPIEVWRTATQVAHATRYESAVNLEVAWGVVEKMDKSPSRSAIEACLNVDWVPQGSPVRLEDPEIRNGLFRNVILPLEREIAIVS